MKLNIKTPILFHEMSKIENYIEYYPNGEIKEDGILKDGEKHGFWTEWFDNGNKKRIESYKDGKCDGSYIGWYKNGQKRYEGTYQDGKYKSSKQWNEDGSVKE